MPRKLLDVSRLHELGWRHSIDLREGIESSYRWYLEHRDQLPVSRGGSIQEPPGEAIEGEAAQ
jgi:GDP-L-fucose synthase